jgi:MoaA/NifB/PqqE/SkfB family radical SAM enzyme
MYKWRVCPIQGRQLLDVDPDDIIEDFRICKTYKSGGGYDQFPAIAQKRGIIKPHMLGSRDIQFVVQLHGCHLRCPYCYVTKDGILGETVEYTSSQLRTKFVKALATHGAGVFHLMGGAPALYLSHWPELLDMLNGDFLFHSDLLLTESYYTISELEAIARPEALYAVNIKGVTDEDHLENTGKPINWDMFWRNLTLLRMTRVNFYLTFTAPDPINLSRFCNDLEYRYGGDILEDSFVIKLKQYDAIKEGPAW